MRIRTYGGVRGRKTKVGGKPTLFSSYSIVICPPPQSLPPIPARHLFQGLASQFLPPVLARSPFQGLASQFLPPVLACVPFQGLASQFLSPVQKNYADRPFRS